MSEYQVFPHQPSYKTVSLSEYKSKNIHGLKSEIKGIFWGVIFIVIFALLGFGCFQLCIAILVATFAVAIIDNFVKNKNASDLEQKKTDEANQGEDQRVTKDAEYLTRSLTNIQLINKTC